LALLAPSPSRAQATSAPADTAGGTRGRFFTKKDAELGLLFAVGTVAMFPLDRRIALDMQGSSLRSNGFVKRTADVFRVTAIPGSTIIGGSLYVVGRLSRSSRMAELGLHGTEALLVGQAFGSLTKGMLGRARPYQVADSNAHDFEFLRGFRKGNDYSSLPSGHAIAAFAAASAVTAETSRWWPQSTPYVGTVMYGGAVMVALERLYNDKHWASDVMLAAGIGTFSGLKVVKFNHDHPGNPVDRVLLAASIVPTANGTALAWSITPAW
jgi:membrane-associated phospholipid phosphatase